MYDFFELLDGLVRGVIYFFYNLIVTAATVLRHPRRGPLRLWRRNRNPAVRQIGGITFLFVSFLLVLASFLSPQVAGGAPTADQIRATAANLPERGLADYWPSVAGALVATIIVDSLLRYVLRHLARRRRGRREAAVALVEYSLFLPIVAAIPSLFIAGSIVLRLWGMWPDLTVHHILAIEVAAFFLVCAGTGALAGWWGTTQFLLRRKGAPADESGPGLGPRPAPSLAARLLSALLSGTIVSLALIIGLAVTFDLEMSKATERLRQTSLALVSLNCRPDGQNLRVTAVLWNPGERPVPVELDDLRLEIGTVTTRNGIVTSGSVWPGYVTWSEPAEGSPLLLPESALRLSGVVEYPMMRYGRQCMLGFDDDIDAVPTPERTIAGQPARIE